MAARPVQRRNLLTVPIGELIVIVQGQVENGTILVFIDKVPPCCRIITCAMVCIKSEKDSVLAYYYEIHYNKTLS